MKLTMVEIWDLFEHRHLFKARNPSRELDDGYHLAEIQAVLGSPPLKFLNRSERSLQFWDKYGSCSHPLPRHFYECIHNLTALITFDLLYQVIGKTQLPSQILISRR